MPHLELGRRNLTIAAPTTQPEAKTITAPVLDIKCDLTHIHTIREALIKSNLPLRMFGVFIPPSFLKEKPEAVYATAVRHVKFLSKLEIIPVSGIHHTVMDMTGTATDDQNQTFY